MYYRPVKVIRLLARDTVEEIMYARAVSKLQLTNAVIEEGRFSLLDQAQSAAAGLQVGQVYKTQTFVLFKHTKLSSLLPLLHVCFNQLSEILKFGIDKLLSSDESSIQEVKLEKILGSSRGGQWMDDEDLSLLKEEEEEDEEDRSESEVQSMFNQGFSSLFAVRVIKAWIYFTTFTLHQH